MKNAICNEIIELATERNIDHWMDLVNKVKGSFPGLETQEALEEHRNTVLDFMDKGPAICAKTDNKIVGTLLFSKESGTLCFLAVDPEYPVFKLQWDRLSPNRNNPPSPKSRDVAFSENRIG